MIMFCVPAVWRVTCISDEVCVSRGSTVHIYCTYSYPSDKDYEVTNRFWFTKHSADGPEDLKQDPELAGRVQYHCDDLDRSCSLTIKELRDTDSMHYTFRIMTNIPTGKYNGPGVKITVKGNIFMWE